jgi:Rad3-related DNA helicase
MDTAEPLIRAAGGGAFVLFTSHRALNQAAALLRARWGAAAPFRLFVQGEAPRERMLQVAEHYYHAGGRSPINQPAGGTIMPASP